MKKIYLAFVLFFAVNAAFAQCSPDTTLKSPGIKPDKIPNGVVGTAYSQVITLLVPLDTSVVYNGTTVQVKEDSATVIYLSDFPTGFTYDCNKLTRTWNGGERGCARLYGTPTSQNRGVYKIWVKTKTYFKIIGLSGNFNEIDSSAVDFTIDWPSALDEAKSFGISKMHPNPASTQLTLEFEKYTSQTIVQVSNIMGEAVEVEATFSPNTGEIKLDVSKLKSGVYFIKTTANNSVSQAKFIKD